LCAVAIRYDQWFVHRTTKGRHMKDAFGEHKAVLLWRGFLLAGMVFGVSLATGQINPMTW
jgi:hypothetical protein